MQPGQPDSTSPGTATAWPVLPDYEILGELGRGGMGTVYKARQVRLNRVVALKVVRLSFLAGDDAEVLRRFEREARAAAQLRHPNIVVIYDFNQHDDVYYIAMEYVAGRSLQELVNERGPLPVGLAAEYVRQTALGLQHAFEHGMVHRDIKPTNLLVQAAAPDVAGTVKILDMGLVFFPHDDVSHLTVQGTVIGTPDYIAPEQTLDSHAVDVRADLYSLGCTFYFLLTGKPPFAGARLMEKLLAHQRKEPAPVTQLRTDVPQLLGQVVHRLLAKNPEDRFQTPADLIEALEMFGVDDASIHSIPRSLSLRDTMDRLSSGKTIPSMPAPPGGDERGAGEAAAGESKADESPQQFAELRGHRGWVTALQFAPNRRTLVSGGVDAGLRFWDLADNPRDRVIEHAHASDITCLAIAPDSEVVASGSSVTPGALGGLVRLWNFAGTQTRCVGEIRLGMTTVEALAFSADGRLLVTGGSDRAVRLWDVNFAAPRLLATLKGHAAGIKEVTFGRDRQSVLSADSDGTVRLWNLKKFWSKEEAVLAGHWGQVYRLAYDPLRDRLAVAALDQKVTIWQLGETKANLKTTLSGHAGVVRVVNFNPDGETLLSVCDRGKMMLWDLSSGRPRRRWQLPLAQRSSLAATFDGRYLAVGKTSGTIDLCRLYPR